MCNKMSVKKSECEKNVNKQTNDQLECEILYNSLINQSDFRVGFRAGASITVWSIWVVSVFLDRV